MQAEQKKCIWIINPYNMPPQLGPLNRHYYFGKYLRDAGHAPTVFVSSQLHNSDRQMIADKRKYLAYTDCPFPYVFVKTRSYGGRISRILAMLDFYRNLMRCADEFPRPDVIIGSSTHPLAILAAIKLGKRYHVPCVGEVRDLWPESFVAYGIIGPRNPLLKLLYACERWLYQKVDRLIFTMGGGRDYLLDKGWDAAHGGPIDLDKVFHINNGVDLAEFDENRTLHVLEDPDLENPDTFKVAYAGSIRRVNHLQPLIDAAQCLKEACPSVRMLIYGDGDEREGLAARAREKGLDNIVFKGGIEKKYIPSVLSRADVNLIHVRHTPIMRYGCSLNKLFDYLAAGRPIVTDLPMNYDVVEENQAGIFAKGQDGASIAEAICEVMKMPEPERAQMGERGRRAAEQYDYKALTEKLLDVLTISGGD